MAALTLSPAEKRAYGKEVGEILVRNHGKQKYYSVSQVQKASKESKQGIDWQCWAMSLYTSPKDFKTYHDSIGESCNYGAMKGEMTSALTDGASEDWFDLDLSWLEWPDIELPSIFDFLDGL